MAVLSKCGDKILIVYHSNNYCKVLVMPGKIHRCQVLILFYNHLLIYFAGIIHDKECKSAPGLLPVRRYDALLRWWQTGVVIQYVYTIHFHLLNFYSMFYMIGHFWFFRYIHFYFIWNEILYTTDSNRCITLKMYALPTRFVQRETVSSMSNTYKQGRCSKSIWAISFSLSQVLNIRQELLCEQLARIQYDDMTGCR